MTIRKRQLPPPWYPQTQAQVDSFIGGLPGTSGPGAALACVAPHAGWEYSGKIAVQAIAALDSSAQTVIVVGGHLPKGSRPLVAEETGVDTPQGPLMMDDEFRSALTADLDCAPDRCQDNTVEILLPFVHHYFSRARLLWLRLPAEIASFETGKRLAGISRRLGRISVLVGSTDLTHYGPNYDFMPVGGGDRALDWVRQVNDAAFLSAVLSGDPARVIERSEADQSACSAGAVAAAMGFASVTTDQPGRLLAYGTSADSRPAASFVGYAALIWPS